MEEETRNEISGATIFGNVIQARTVTTHLPPTRPTALAGLPRADEVLGRDAEIDWLFEGFRRGAVSVLSGAPGVGKTSLAVAAAHLARTDGNVSGVLFRDLHGYGDADHAQSGSQVLGEFLRALGVATGHVPESESEREALYRSVLTDFAERGQRILILLDNVASARDVLMLLPNVATHPVLVTSRNSLGDLPGARLLSLPMLSEQDAVRVIEWHLQAANERDDRIASDPASAGQLVRRCGGLPLALRICAALLASDSFHSVAELVEIFDDAASRLDVLSYDEGMSVEAAFDLSYRYLDEDSARLFRLLALIPGHDFGVQTAAALLQLPVSDARGPLGKLVRAHLVQSVERRRYRLHDLLRQYAAKRVKDDPLDGLDGFRRIKNHYLDATRTAYEGVRAGGEDSRRHALSWFEEEQMNLMTLLEWIDATEDAEYFWKLYDPVISLFDERLAPELLGLHTKAVVVARHTGDLKRVAAAADAAATILHRVNRPEEEALALFGVLKFCEETEDRELQRRTLLRLGHAYRRAADFDLALEFRARALAICREDGDESAEAGVLALLGETLISNGRTKAGISQFGQALRIRRELGDKLGEADTLVTLGETLEELGDPMQARYYLDKALAIYAEEIMASQEVNVLHLLARTVAMMGQHGHAFEYLARARDVIEQLADQGQPRAENAHLQGEIRLENGEHELALPHLDDAVRAYRQSGDLRGEGRALLLSATCHWRLGRRADAKRSAQQAETTCEHAFLLDEAHSARELLATIEKTTALGPPRQNV